MGLINFLKQKFSRWKEEKKKDEPKEEASVPEEQEDGEKEEGQPASSLPAPVPSAEDRTAETGPSSTAQVPQDEGEEETEERAPTLPSESEPEAEKGLEEEVLPTLDLPEEEEDLPRDFPTKEEDVSPLEEKTIPEAEGKKEETVPQGESAQKEERPPVEEEIVLTNQAHEEEGTSTAEIPLQEKEAESFEEPKEVESIPEEPKQDSSLVPPSFEPSEEAAIPQKESAPEPEKEKPDAPAPEETEAQVMDKYIAGLDKSRMGFTDRMKKLAARNKVVNREYFDQLERILIEADVGVDLSLELIRETASEAALQKIESPEALNDLLIDKMFIGYANEGGSFKTDLELAADGPTVVFMCGVNGGGKTTTTAKLAKKYKDRGKKVLLVAADTFRAGAVEQLTYWAQRVGVDILSRPLSDPASLCFDALKKAKEERYDLVFVDTAGRLQNKKALMDELSKVVRVMKKVLPEAPHESLLVIDANTGQNGIDQAKVFKESVPLTGIVITKMDGTSKGGILLAIRKQLSLPVRFIGLGEKMQDLEEFDLDKYLYGLLIGDEEE